MGKRMYLIFDGRACGGAGTDGVTCLDTASDLKEAQGSAVLQGRDCAIYSYDDQGSKLVNERWVQDVFPEGG